MYPAGYFADITNNNGDGDEEKKIIIRKQAQHKFSRVDFPSPVTHYKQEIVIVNKNI